VVIEVRSAVEKCEIGEQECKNRGFYVNRLALCGWRSRMGSVDHQPADARSPYLSDSTSSVMSAGLAAAQSANIIFPWLMF
jgi:hypothetical protein